MDISNSDQLPNTEEELVAYCERWADDILVRIWFEHVDKPAYVNVALSKLSPVDKANWIDCFKRDFREDRSIPHRIVRRSNGPVN